MEVAGRGREAAAITLSLNEFSSSFRTKPYSAMELLKGSALAE